MARQRQAPCQSGQHLQKEAHDAAAGLQFTLSYMYCVWVVERSFAWAARFRRLAKDYERLQTSLLGYHFAAFVCLLLHRAAPLLSISS
jgi:Transposase DDE domain